MTTYVCSLNIIDWRFSDVNYRNCSSDFSAVFFSFLQVQTRFYQLLKLEKAFHNFSMIVDFYENSFEAAFFFIHNMEFLSSSNEIFCYRSINTWNYLRLTSQIH